MTFRELGEGVTGTVTIQRPIAYARFLKNDVWWGMLNRRPRKKSGRGEGVKCGGGQGDKSERGQKEESKEGLNLSNFEKKT